MYRYCVAIIPALLCFGGPTLAAENPWRLIQPAELAGQVAAANEPWIQPDKFQAASLDVQTMRNALAGAPAEFGPLPAQPHIIELPTPDGKFAPFEIVESPVMEPGLAAKFPEIKTYVGWRLDAPGSLRCDWTPQGFHAQVLSPEGNFYIDPYWKGDNTQYSSYYKGDLPRVQAFSCLTDSQQAAGGVAAAVATAVTPLVGDTLRTYRLAVAATGEYTAFHGGTKVSAMAAIVTAVNRVTGIYENELAIRMVLIANNDAVVYTNAATDPYTNNDGVTMLGQNQTNLTTVIGSANYDIGHVFSTGGGGVAFLGVVCSNSNKARGVTGQPNPTGDPFYVDYVAHEMGHQFGADHCFNSTSGSCGGGNRNGPTAYEPGSGATIMAYAGICGLDNLQANSDAMFHSVSLAEIANYVGSSTGNLCDIATATGNTIPSVSAGLNYVIPRQTPFELTAAASDPDGDTLTFSWEQRDLGPATTLAAADNGTSPIERPWPPSLDPVRTIPRLGNLLNNTVPVGEKWPNANRTMDWQVVVRDNRPGGGGVATDDMVVTVTTASGPFTVTFPNTAVSLAGSETITWNVAGTDGPPVNAAAVDILLSRDGGLTYPITLASATPNDGSELVVIPGPPTSTARIKIRGTDNIFFDISNTNFTITSCAALAQLEAEPGGVPKNRFVSFVPPLSGDAAIRLTLLDLPAPFESYEGQLRWVGPPTEYIDATSGTSTWAAPLQCEPHLDSWVNIDVLHVYDPAIVPHATYVVQASECGTTDEELFSPPLMVTTSVYGDVAAPFGSVANALDIASVVDRVANRPGAIPLVSAKLQPNVISPGTAGAALDISRCIDAVKGLAYPFPGPTTCP